MSGRVSSRDHVGPGGPGQDQRNTWIWVRGHLREQAGLPEILEMVTKQYNFGIVRKNFSKFRRHNIVWGTFRERPTVRFQFTRMKSVLVCPGCYNTFTVNWVV